MHEGAHAYWSRCVPCGQLHVSGVSLCVHRYRCHCTSVCPGLCAYVDKCLHAWAEGALLVNSWHAQSPVCMGVCVCVRVHARAWMLAGHGVCLPHSSLSPLPSPEEALRTATQEATGSVGTAVATGATPSGALIHILAAPKGLIKVKARGADAAEATKGVATGGAPAGGGRQGTLVLICGRKGGGEGGRRGGAAQPSHPQSLPPGMLSVQSPSPMSKPPATWQ